MKSGTYYPANPPPFYMTSNMMSNEKNNTMNVQGKANETSVAHETMDEEQEIKNITGFITNNMFSNKTSDVSSENNQTSVISQAK